MSGTGREGGVVGLWGWVGEDDEDDIGTKGRGGGVWTAHGVCGDWGLCGASPRGVWSLGVHHQAGSIWLSFFFARDGKQRAWDVGWRSGVRQGRAAWAMGQRGKRERKRGGGGKGGHQAKLTHKPALGPFVSYETL